MREQAGSDSGGPALLADPRPPSSTHREEETSSLLSPSSPRDGDISYADVSIWADFVHVLRTSWMAAIIVGLISGLVAAVILMRDAGLAGDHAMVQGHPLGWHDAQEHTRTLLARGLRHIPNDDEQERLKTLWLSSGTTIKLSTGEDVQFRALFLKGNRELPTFFYDSVHYGISGANPGAQQYTEEENMEANKNLLKDLKRMKPKPSHIFDSVSYSNVSNWAEEGFVVQFSFDDLRRHGYAGLADRNGTLWAEATGSILRLGRKYSQWAVYQWYPYEWGVAVDEQRTRQLTTTTANIPPEERQSAAAAAAAQQEETGEARMEKLLDDKDGSSRLHKNILQVVVPTRTGFDKAFLC